MTLADFLLARIAEDEGAARIALDEFSSMVGGTPPKWESKRQWEQFPAHMSHHIRTQSPARVLAECEAKRRIVEAVPYRRADGADSDDAYYQWVSTLRHLAAVYADHPDYRDEWRP